MLAGYETGGVNQQSAGLRNILRYYGTTAPHTRAPYSEAMLFGIAGGPGVMYWTWEVQGQDPLATVFFRNLEENGGRFFERACRRINAGTEVYEAADRQQALDHLRDALRSSRPPLAYLDMASMPYLFLPEQLRKWFTYEAVVCGLDEEAGYAELDDRAPVPWHFPLETLANARAAMSTQQHRLVAVVPPRQYPDLEAAIDAGIRDCADSMLRPTLTNLGLPALEKWSALVRHPDDRKGWRTMFPPGPALFEALLSVYMGIVTGGTGSDALRGLYADFLDEAAGVTDRPDYERLAGQLRLSGKLWTQFANSVLPDNVGPLRQARAALNQHVRLLEGEGQPVVAGMANAMRTLADVRATVRERFPMSQEDVDGLFEDLAEQLTAIHTVESDVFAALDASVPAANTSGGL